MAQSVSLSPSHSDHDGTEFKDTGDQTENTQAVVRFGDAGGKRHVAIKFPLPSTGWLDGKTIVTATLTLRSADDDVGSFEQRVYLENAASPANLQSGAGVFGISARNRTTGFVEFGSTTLGDWINGATYSYSGDGGTAFADLIAELKTLQTPSSIAALNFLFINISGSGERLARSFDNGSAIPVLELVWVDALQDVPVRIIETDVYNIELFELDVTEVDP